MYRSESKITNDGAGQVTVSLEPSCEEYTLEPGDQLVVVGVSTDPGDIGVDQAESNSWVISAWRNADLSVYLNGVFLGEFRTSA